MLIVRNEYLSVGELTQAQHQESQPKVSRHLAQLRSNILTDVRQGR